VVVWGRGDAGEVPEIALPLVETRVHGAYVKEQDAGCALDEPAAIQRLDACVAHCVEGCGEMGIGGLFSLYLHGAVLYESGPMRH
jgi:hypothetical protein